MIAAMVLLTFFDVTGRTFFHVPVMGALELTEIAMLVLGGIAIFHTATRRGHIAVDVLFNKFPRRIRIIIASLGLLVGAVTWGAIAYQVFWDGVSKIEVHRTTDVLRIPVGPFEFVFAFGLALFSLTMLIQAFRPLPKPNEDQGQTGI
jgi:TRAP-type C4-dicarboxylate transport system permease small subunit